MKTLNIAVTSLLLIAGEVFAASTVSDVVARQRWPWNGKVDVDFTVSNPDATATCDVEFSATWDGQTTPAILGTAYGVVAGQHRFVFDPATLGLTNKTLTGFTVTSADPVAHKYLILDLVDGGYSYLADVPVNGWTDEYKSTKMVFRRIPKTTTCRNGLTGNALIAMFGPIYGDDVIGPTSGNTRYGKPAQYMYNHDANFSSDFYLAIFPMTVAQYQQVSTKQSSTDYKIKEIAYSNLRGSDSAGIYWPQTGYTVAPGSFIDKLRNLVDGQLVIDLPVEDQWEVAARCGQTTIFAEGGVLAEKDFAGITNILNKIAVWCGNGDTGFVSVGTRDANPLGLYDMCGMCYEWTNNTDYWNANATTTCRLCVSSDGKVDYVGRLFGFDSTSKLINRVVKGVNSFNPNTPLYMYFPSYRSLKGISSSTSIAARFAIHLKPLDFTTAN